VSNAFGGAALQASHASAGIAVVNQAARDPANPRQLLPAADVGDHLHLNLAGYKLLADTMPALLFS
jgi:lysophospholipase L1-like esterase